jgi:AraC family transcriptional regulator, regulatory protein of adaptative response / methylated-DNA-[protein]-cysteine methyltransferase
MLNFANTPAREENSSYARISRALLYLAENYRRQPSLNDAAGVAGLSPWHFQREFTRLTGISPKSFIGHLTLEHAKRALLDGRSVLDASWSVGLSGPSRLHDLTLKIEAMSPGEYARRGADLTIFYGWRATLLGRALLAATERGLCGISFAADEEGPAQHSDMVARWPNARFVADDKFIDAYAEQIFFRPDSGNAVPVRLSGTPWQINVWKALLTIPAGSAVAYGTLAGQVCTSRATRATASAIARNPVALLIPCHRVIAASGALGGYRWGESRKRALLALEAARSQAAG